MHSIASYLIYAAVLVRAALWFDGNPPVRWAMFAMLGVFGVIMTAEPLITRKIRHFKSIYLPLQTSLVLVMMIFNPGMDFIPMLFFPLSFQAVRFFKRLGLIWIVGFILAEAIPLLLGWEWELVGVAMLLLFAGLNLLMGGLAYSMEQAELARLESQRLLAELSLTYQQLQAFTAQSEEYAIAQERARLARELHDSVTQTVFSMNLVVQTAQMLVVMEPVRVSDQLDRLQELAHSAVGEIQVLVKQLQPHSVTEEGLISALQKLAAERQQRDGLIIHLDVIDTGFERNFPKSVTTGLYRITQEALNNIVKHARINEAFVRVNLECYPAVLEIEDNGIGFQPEKISSDSGHVGLFSMTERSWELGWKLNVISQPGKGTIIHVEEDMNVETDQ